MNAASTSGTTTRTPRRLALYALADMLGTTVMVAGALWLQNGITFLGDAPHNRAEAWTMVLCGGGLLFWGSTALLRALARPTRTPDA